MCHQSYLGFFILTILPFSKLHYYLVISSLIFLMLGRQVFKLFSLFHDLICTLLTVLQIGIDQGTDSNQGKVVTVINNISLNSNALLKQIDSHFGILENINQKYFFDIHDNQVNIYLNKSSQMEVFTDMISSSKREITLQHYKAKISLSYKKA